MLMVIKNINFSTGSIGLHIPNDIGAAGRDYLLKYIETCQSIDITDINIFFPDSLSGHSHSVLKDIAEETGATLHKENDPKNNELKIGQSTKFEFRRIGDPEIDGSINTEYCMVFSKLNSALEEINSSVTLIGQALNLDDNTFARLQLCIYELAVNSIEHGSFPADSQMITLSISSKKSHISVCYKDNASIFFTTTMWQVDINEQIQSKHKRGLGLFIINRLTQDLNYKRLGGWNVTTFKIETVDDENLIKRRSRRMSKFTMKLVACDIDNSIIVKPIGSIDASTTQSVEEHFANLINNNIKYIIMDFSELSFISSAGIGILLGTVSSLRDRGGDLIFLKVPAQVREIFDILNITDYFLSINSIEELKNSINV